MLVFLACAVSTCGPGGGLGPPANGNSGGNVNRNRNDSSNTNGNTGNVNDNQGNENDNHGGGNPLAVTLFVSSEFPGLNDTVLLDCDLVGDPPDGQTVLFAFTPDDGRVDYNAFSGTGTFVVQESDFGQVFTYACFAVTDTDTGPNSNTVRIQPTPPPP